MCGYRTFSSTLFTPGFDSYSCSCINGTHGDHCEFNVDECAANPCPEHYDCTDLVGDYHCVCDAICMEKQKSGLEAWQVALICIVALLILCIIIILLWYWIKKKKALAKVAPSEMQE